MIEFEIRKESRNKSDWKLGDNIRPGGSKCLQWVAAQGGRVQLCYWQSGDSVFPKKANCLQNFKTPSQFSAAHETHQHILLELTASLNMVIEGIMPGEIPALYLKTVCIGVWMKMYKQSNYS